MSTFLLARRAPIPGGLEVPVAAAAQDGVFTRSPARSEGWSDGRQRRLIDSGLWVPVTSHVLRHREVLVVPWQRARAVRLAGGMVVSHDTARQMWGLLAPDGLHGTSRSSRRTTAVITHRADLPSSDSVEVAWMRITTPPRSPDRFQADRTRDQRLAAAGYVVLRFTWDDLSNRPDDVIERIRRTMAHRARLAA
jgi:hypothetical protein